MAGDASQSRTETATTRRREEARKQGQVALSQELNSAILLFAGLVLLHWTSGDMADQLRQLIHHATQFQDFREWTKQETTQLANQVIQVVLRILGSFCLGVLVVGVAANVGQIGFSVQTDILGIKMERLSPVKGFEKLFSIRSAVRGGWSIFKLVCIVALSIYLIRHRIPEMHAIASMPFATAIGEAWDLIMGVGWAVCGALLVVGGVDFVYQRWQHEEDLKMSRQDIKEEHKQDEGDPQIKSRLRKLQRDAARLRMLQDVPTASVVLTNPTHYAVALRYDRGVNKAPKVIAKGSDLLAKRIARIARENGVPVLERKPLTRALFASVEVGNEIPEALFRAVAEILAYVYRLRRAA